MRDLLAFLALAAALAVAWDPAALLWVALVAVACWLAWRRVSAGGSLGGECAEWSAEGDTQR